MSGSLVGAASAAPGPDAAADDGETLGPLERRILEFESAASAHGGATAAAVRREFGVTLARYHQMLSGVLESPHALRHDPILVHRLRRLRDARTAARVARTFRLDTQDTDD